MTDSSKKSPVFPVKFVASINPKDDAEMQAEFEAKLRAFTGGKELGEVVFLEDNLADYELMMLLSRRSDGVIDEPDLDQALEVQMMRKFGEEIVLPQTVSEEESES